VDRQAKKWVQLKAALGFLLVFMAAVTPEPLQPFAVCFGVLMLALNFGQGGLGVIPAVVLLREYVPNPPYLEILLGVAAFYWVAIEGLRFAKLKQEAIVFATLETLCSIGVLFGLRDIFLKFADEPVLIAIGSGLVVVILLVASLVRFRREAFWSFYRKTKTNLASVLTIGDRMVLPNISWLKEHVEEDSSGADVEKSFDRLFALAILTIALFAIFVVVSRGGFG
jgi:hypothetical protein